MGWYSERTLLFLLIVFLPSCLCMSLEDDETNYVKLLLRDLDGVQQEPGQGQGTIKRHWGISDATAVAGKVFTYPIPEDAFTGNIIRYEVTEAGESSLPEWLLYDEDSQTFSGVPLAKDVGQYYISVKAIGSSQNKSPAAKDVFSIEVVEDSAEARVGESENVGGYCAGGESQTIANLVLDLTLDELNISDRLNTLKRLASFLNMPLKRFKLVPKTEENSLNLNAVMAGSGNAKNISKKGAVAQWKIGCSLSISTEQKAMISKLENAAEDGSLSNVIGFPIIGWHITNIFPKFISREKRQVGRGTPVPGVMPTLYPPHLTEIDEFEITDDTLIPETRIIPTMASPTLTQPTHHHRHGHGEFGFERGHHNRHNIESQPLYTSPTLNHNHFQSAFATPIGATPVIVPIRPTKYLSSTIQVDQSIPGRYFPEEHTPLGGLDSSMIIPTPVIGVTDALPTQTFISSIDAKSGDIKPTKSQTIVEKTKKPPGTPNFKPTIERRMKKLTMIAGKVWKFQIPHDTFVDMEDGDTRHLKLLFLTSERTAVQPTSWIQFDPEKQMLYALPLDEHIGKYEFILEAMDNEGASTNDRLDIHVWQHQSARAKHHEFSVSLKYNKWQYPITIDWNIEFAKRLSRYYGDRNESNIAVQAVLTEPVTTITWSNDSLPTYPCPTEEISELTNKLIDENNNEVAKPFKKAMGSDFNIIDASINLLGVCHSPVSTTSPTHSNFPPMLRNPIERINTTVGEILRFRIPDDTFYDFEDGSTRYLTLTFLTIENIRPPKSSWVQFDHKSQELYGLPFDGDTGRHEFQLVAMDNNGLQINDVFVIEVHPRPPKKWNVEFSLHIDHDYEEFSKDISKKVLVAWKLAKLYDDPDPRYITVGSISKGSVVYAWTNNTLPHDPCPKRTIDKLVKNMINEDGTLSNKLTDAMLPEFKIIKADAMPLGICLGEVTPTSVTIAPPPVTQDAEPAATTDDDIYITTIIPAVVIAVMLIIAALVACFLYRKKRKGKLNMQDNTFIGNRAPVIFGDEMEEKPDPAKPPVIMREEKPPLAPPDYLRSSVSSRDSTPHLDRVEQTNLRNTNADLHTDPSPPYQPPPPFTTNRDNKNSRPKGTPTYRQPPPYMPPVPP